MAPFTGTYRYAVDHKGRVNIPATFRKSLSPEAEETLVVTRGLEGCLFVYPLDEWRKVESTLRALPFTQKNARYFVRVLASNASICTLDNQGRATIPRALLELAQIESDVLIIGALDRIELWNPAVFEKYLSGAPQGYEEVAESLLL